MDVTDLLSQLNDAQRKAVCTEQRYNLVLAGAGSGKTRVLVHRIAWLIQMEAIAPSQILAVTFTNKAAAEMRGRIEQMLQRPAYGMWIGTFHGLAHRLLRAHYQDANLPEQFQILDSEDQLRIIKQSIKALNLDDKQWQPKQMQWYINSQKDEGMRARHLQGTDLFSRKQIEIYQTYELACQRGGLVDFAELLLRALELLRDNPTLRTHYQQRFRHVLVDEFQDTNAIQYAWVRLMAGEHCDVMIVGDDDQSIYGWRGARIENIHQFQHDFQPCDLIRLEQNYRSTATILNAANAVIAHNQARLGKELWTQDHEGELIGLYAGFNELDEARFIAEQIQQWSEQGNIRRDVAILYRSNAQSRVLEEALLTLQIPYRIYGGLRFFERAEIKDALAYLRLLNNPQDDAAFERVINTPTRGIGERSVAKLREMARAEQLSLWQVLCLSLQQKKFPARTANALQGFVDLIIDMQQAIQGTELYEQVDHVILHAGLLAMHQKDKGEKAQSRIENLQELVSAARQYEPALDDELPMLTSFLAHASLESGEHQGGAHEDCVQLMTLHTAKGLEFPLVFLSGAENGLFPSFQSQEDPQRMEEERRLMYVGITRAKDKLFISYAESRRLYGKEQYNSPSRFIFEIPPELLQDVRMSQASFRPALSPQLHHSVQDTGFMLGETVYHPSFGDGVILDIEGQGAKTRVHIQFADVGAKWLMLAYAKLQKLA